MDTKTTEICVTCHHTPAYCYCDPKCAILGVSRAQLRIIETGILREMVKEMLGEEVFNKIIEEFKNV